MPTSLFGATTHDGNSKPAAPSGIDLENYLYTLFTDFTMGVLTAISGAAVICFGHTFRNAIGMAGIVRHFKHQDTARQGCRSLGKESD